MNALIDLLKKGDVVAFCGAGLSCESGIPPFRGEKGLWEKYDPQQYVSQEGLNHLLKSNPLALRTFLLEVLEVMLRAKPNPAHQLLSYLEKQGSLIGVITQNIDDLHYQAGSTNVTELHGNIYRLRCESCLDEMKLDKTQLENVFLHLKNSHEPNRVIKVINEFIGMCPICQNRLKSSVVLFGQMLSQDEIEKAEEYITQGKTLLCIGTSGTVSPAVSFPYYAKEKGAKIITINPRSTVLDEIADVMINEEAGNFAERLIEALP